VTAQTNRAAFPATAARAKQRVRDRVRAPDAIDAASRSVALRRYGRRQRDDVSCRSSDSRRRM